MVFKALPRHPGGKKSWAFPSPRPKSSKTREEGREKKEEELEEDQHDSGKAKLLSPPHPHNVSFPHGPTAASGI
jgi:hypothetical protein